MDRGVRSDNDRPQTPPTAVRDDTDTSDTSRGRRAAVVVPPKSSPFDYLFLMRPMILVPVWTFFLLGAGHAQPPPGETPSQGTILTGLLSFSLLIGAVYIVNQIADREADRANEKLFLISHGVIPTRTAWIEAAVLTAGSFLLGAIYLRKAFLLILSLSAALGAAYSIRPARFKARPVLDVVSNAVGNGVLNTMAGWLVVNTHLSGVEVLLPYPFAVASVHLVTTIADIPGDNRSSLKTSGTMLGERNASLVSTALMVLAALTAALVGNKTAFYSSILSLPAFLIPIGAAEPELIRGKSLMPAKWATIVFSMAAVLRFKTYLIWLVVVVFATRIYYKKRFSISYPDIR